MTFITRADVLLHQISDRPTHWEVRVMTSGVMLFVTDTPQALDAQLHAYSAGLLAGMEAGRKAQQQEIRDALGLA